MRADSTGPDGTDTIVLIHGLWVTALSWERWVSRYQARGYRVLAPHWPGVDAGVGQLRGDPSQITGIGVTEIADHYDRIIRDLGRPPVVIGHCLGGLVAQILLDRGLGAAGVSIDPAPARGVVSLPFATLKAASPVPRNPASRHQAVTLTARRFHNALTSTFDDQQAAAAYERYYVPAPRRVIYQVSFASITRRPATRVDFTSGNRAPLLLIADGNDRMFPAPYTRSASRKYRTSTAVTSYKEFPGRSHLTTCEPGWEHLADYALRWAMDNALNGT